MTELAEAQAALDDLTDPALAPTQFEFARAVVLAARALGLNIGIAESLTGGLVCELLTSIPGASACIRGGVVAYQNDVKSSILQVDANWLERFGPINSETAIAMASGVAQVLQADFGLGCTGVAGPDPQGAAPVGTVHIAVFDRRSGSSRAQSLQFTGSRDDIRVQTAIALLGLLLDCMLIGSSLNRSGKSS